MSKKVLFCFPYAGGSANVYNAWKKYLDPSVELRPIELTGRGRRISEKLYDSIAEMIDDVFRVMTQTAIPSEYALFGHSLGALIAYEVAQELKRKHLPLPKHIFFSGRGAPHIKREDEKKYHLMDEAEFEREVLDLGGTPPELFKQPELMRIFLPLLRNDFRLAETEICYDTISPFDHDISVFLGKEDSLTPDQCDGWKEHTKQFCRIEYFDGGHFFLHEHQEHIVHIINMQLCNRNYALY